MKVFSLNWSVLLVASAAYASSKIAVYELPGKQRSESPSVSIKNSVLYLADKLGAGEFYSIGHKDEVVDFIELVHEKHSHNPELLVVLKGLDSPEHIHKDWTPSFQIEGHNKDNKVQGLVKTLVKKLPKQIAESSGVSGVSGVSELSDEISYVPSEHECNGLDQHFKCFGNRLPQEWSDFVERSSVEFEGNQQVVGVMSSGLKLVNDKLYISELMHMVKLASSENRSAEFIVANLDSLYSIGSRIGYKSRTYSVAKGALLESISALQTKFDVTLVAIGTDHRLATDASNLAKRHNGLEVEFTAFSKRGATASKSCFSVEDSCKDSTKQCNGHGTCTKIQDNCWQCACVASYDKKTSKTTKWAGHDCAKKDIAAQAHLLLWTAVALLAMLVCGLKLLYSVGNVELPGVLQAATIDTSR